MTPLYTPGPSKHRCGLHSRLLVDLRTPDGIAQACPDCVQVVLPEDAESVVRQLWVRKEDAPAVKAASKESLEVSRHLSESADVGVDNDEVPNA